MQIHCTCPKLYMLCCYHYQCKLSRYDWKRGSVSVWIYYNKKKNRRIPVRTVRLREQDNDLTPTPLHSPVNDLPGHTCDLGILYRVQSRRSGFDYAEQNCWYPARNNKPVPMQRWVQCSNNSRLLLMPTAPHSSAESAPGPFMSRAIKLH
jgi:hypothetical protein